MTYRPSVINHRKTVKHIQRILEKKIPAVSWEYLKKRDINKIDIKGYRNGNFSAAVIVFDEDEFTKKGELTPLSKTKLRAFSYNLIKTGTEKQIVVFTDFQAFHQWKKITKKTNNVDLKKSGGPTAETYSTEGDSWFLDNTPEHNLINILIDFPVFRNNDWSKSKNRTLTFSQILTELKLGFLQLQSLSKYEYEPDDPKDLPKVRRGNNKTEASVEHLVKFFLKKRGYRTRKSKSKNRPLKAN